MVFNLYKALYAKRRGAVVCHQTIGLPTTCKPLRFEQQRLPEIAVGTIILGDETYL